MASSKKTHQYTKYRIHVAKKKNLQLTWSSRYVILIKVNIVIYRRNFLMTNTYTRTHNKHTRTAWCLRTKISSYKFTFNSFRRKFKCFFLIHLCYNFPILVPFLVCLQQTFRCHSHYVNVIACIVKCFNYFFDHLDMFLEKVHFFLT